MESPIIIFILLFIVVIILLLLQGSNKKFADKISILEQTLDMKADAITSLKETYLASRKALDKNAVQIQEIEDKKQKLINFQANKVSLEEIIRDKNTLLKKQQEMYEGNLQDHKSMIANLKKESKEQNNSLDNVKKIYDNVMEEAKKKHFILEDLVHTKNNKTNELSTLLSKTQLEVKEEKKKFKRLQEEFTQSQVEVKKNYSDSDAKMRDKEVEMSKFNITFNELVEELKVNITNLEESVASKKGTSLEQAQQYKNVVRLHEEKIDVLDNEMKIQVQEYTQQIKQHEEENSKNINIISGQSFENKSLEKSNLKYVESLESLEKEMSFEKASSAKLQLEYDKNKQISQINKDRLKQNILEQSKDILGLKENVSRLEEGVHTQTSILTELKTRYKETVSVHDKIKAELQEKNKTLNEVLIRKTSKVTGLEKNNLMYVKSIEKLEKSIILKTDAHTVLQVEYDKNKQTTKKDKALSKETILGQFKNISELKENIFHLEEELSSQKSMISKLETVYQETVSTHGTIETGLQERIKSAEAHLKREQQSLGDKIKQKKAENNHLALKEEKALLAYKKEHDARVQTIETHTIEIVRLEDEYRESQKSALLKQEQNKKEIVQLNRERILAEQNKNEQIALVNKALMQKHQEVLALTNKLQVFDEKNLDKRLRQQMASEDSQKLYMKLEQKSQVREQQLRQTNKEIEDKLKSNQKEFNHEILKKEKDVLGLERNAKRINIVHQKELDTLNLALQQEEATSGVLRKTIHIKEDIIGVLKEGKEEMPASAQSTVMDALRAGESKHAVAKKFNIPVKRVELIMKFDKIQHK